MTSSALPYPATTTRLLDHPAALTNIIRRIAEEAGEAILPYYDESGYTGETQIKADNSPVTLADHAADKVIREALADSFPGIPILTEETVKQVNPEALFEAPHYWVVDPLDGTRHFREGSPYFTVNIALVEGGRPTAGVILLPATGEGYAGWVGGRAFRWNEETEREHDMKVRAVPAAGAVVYTSHTVKNKPLMDSFLSQIKLARHLHRSSSVKLCEIAAGRADLYPQFRQTCYWDIAAGQAILEAAGGAVLDLKGESLTYGPERPDFINPNFVACGDLDYLRPVLEEFLKAP